ncbi:MAG: c-type cytochrome, partial [Pseudomonadota bacterium]
MKRYLLLILPLLALSAPAAADPAQLYQQHCAGCHGANRLGAMGPALLPDNLSRLRQPEAVKVIQEGRAATQMPAFGTTLKGEEIRQLAQWIYTPVTPAPAWTEADIRASRIV